MKSKLVFIMMFIMLFTGCVRTQYVKELSVVKDANGKIIQTIEREGVIQDGQAQPPVKFEHFVVK